MAEPLDLIAGNRRALRIEPNTISPNIIGGNASNLVLEGMRSMALDILGKFRRTGSEPPSLRRIEVAFKNFAELDAPVQLVATLGDVHSPGPLSLRVEAQQLDRTFAIGEFQSA